MAATHRYRTELTWTGSTSGGYRTYDRRHRVSAPPAVVGLDLSSDPAFLGDPQLLNPEQLLLAAASSCQLLSFLALAARAGVDVVRYDDHAEATMPAVAASAGPMRITAVVLRPRIVVADGTDPDQVQDLVRAGHDACYVANTLAAPVTVEAEVEHAGRVAPAPR